MDDVLQVNAWWAPWETSPREALVDGAERRAPHWWRGDEDAAQSFLGAMGVTL